MGKGIFITATGTDVGKTYVTGLLVKKLREAGLNAGYYKAALSGAEITPEGLLPGDADFVRRMAGLDVKPQELVSYIYEEAVSPHLAALREGNPVELAKISEDYAKSLEKYEYVTMEGSHTYAGNPLGCSTALAVLKILEEDKILEKCQPKAEYFNNLLNEAFGNHKNIGEIRHINLINALELVTDKQTKTGFDGKLRIGYEIYKKALPHGLLLRPLGNVIYFNPPLNIEEKDLEKAVRLAKIAMDEVLG